jgi:hypothetical protein
LFAVLVSAAKAKTAGEIRRGEVHDGEVWRSSAVLSS